MSVGSPGAERQITNVADGTEDHDAVNLEQLNAAVAGSGSTSAYFKANGAMDGSDNAVASGKVKALGVSNFTQGQTAALQHFLGHKLATTQPEISPLRITCFENGELDQAMMMGLTPLAWSPLGGGRLANPESERDTAVAAELDRVADEQGVSRTVAA